MRDPASWRTSIRRGTWADGTRCTEWEMCPFSHKTAPRQPTSRNHSTISRLTTSSGTFRSRSGHAVTQRHQPRPSAQRFAQASAKSSSSSSHHGPTIASYTRTTTRTQSSTHVIRSVRVQSSSTGSGPSLVQQTLSGQLPTMR